MEFKRDKYLEKLIEKKKNSLIKVITGARRSGKSYLMNTLFYNHLISAGIPDSNIIRFAFDNDENLDLLEQYYPDEPVKLNIHDNYYQVNSKKFRAFIKDRTNDSEDFYLLLDEIQMLDSFVGTLNGFLTHSNFDVYVSGSNSYLLSSEIETRFRGRKSSVHVLPLSFSEFMTGIDLSIPEAWKEYIVTGGIPIVYKQSRNDRFSYLSELCHEVYLKDIIGRNKVNNPEILGELFGVLASCIGSGVSPSGLEKVFMTEKKEKVSDDTINNYIDHFADSFVVSKARKYNIKGKKYINSPYKIYFEDIGVRNAETGFRQIEETHIMENIIYNELRYRGFNVDVGEVDINEITDRTDTNGKRVYARKALEVDFIACSADRKYYIQSCLNLANEETMAREKRSLWYIGDSFRKIIITKDGLPPRKDENGFTILDIYDFLLNGNSLDI